MMDIISNPMFIAIVAGTITYAYMWWSNENKHKNKKVQKKPVNIIIPAIVTFVVWGLVYGYYLSMGQASAGDIDEQVIPENINMNTQATSKAFKLIEDKGMSLDDARGVSSDSVRSYQLVGRGLNIPNNVKLPDVFLETY
jgi:hypothetical protein